MMHDLRLKRNHGELFLLESGRREIRSGYSGVRGTGRAKRSFIWRAASAAFVNRTACRPKAWAAWTFGSRSSKKRTSDGSASSMARHSRYILGSGLQLPTSQEKTRASKAGSQEQPST